ncbi:MAG: carbohydrate ABC transporter substrate-binding protein [Deltaproteobacteria bacterium]|nr:carbohydrate ABC transporter substrate-binding protein [Deltaproteobacteria bacterium]
MKRYLFFAVMITTFIVIGVKLGYCSTVVEFWTAETQSDRMKTIQLLMDTFQALNPDITVNLVPVEENDMPAQMAAASAAGKLPGLVEGSSELMMAFGEEGIMDTISSTALVNSIGKSRFFQGALKMLETPFPDKYYGLPYHGWVQGIWYRADWFKDAGLDPPDTWGNILKAAKKFYEPEKNKYGILVGTKAENYAEQCFTHFALSNEAAEFNAEGDLIFNSKEMLEVLRYYAELAKYNPPGPQTWRARDYYLQGKMAMFFYSTYIMDDLALAEAAAGSLTNENFPQLEGSSFDPQLVDNTRVVTTIMKKRKSSYGSIVALGLIDQKSEEKNRAAGRLVQFLFEPSSYITFLHMSPGGMNPMLRDIAQMPEYLNDPMGIFKRYGREKIEEIISGLDSIGSFTIVGGKSFPASGKIFAKQIIPRMIYAVTIEGMKEEDAIKWAEKQMSEVINE